MEKQELPEKECPECKGKIDWIIVRSLFGSPQFNGLCKKCNIILRNREVPEITKGRNLERKGTFKNIPALDKRITSLPCDVQIGILRERQK